jgi:hypothetical protein
LPGQSFIGSGSYGATQVTPPHEASATQCARHASGVDVISVGGCSPVDQSKRVLFHSVPTGVGGGGKPQGEVASTLACSAALAHSSRTRFLMPEAVRGA